MNSSHSSQSVVPITSQQSNIPASPLLPLARYHAYQDRESISAQALSLSTVELKADRLDRELITLIQQHCSPDELHVLTTINKIAYAVRVYNVPHLHFKTAAQIENFLSYCPNMQQKALSSSDVHFQNIKKLSLTLSRALTIEQCTVLFSSLPNVKHLEIVIDGVETQILARLQPLLKAAKPLALECLTIEGVEKGAAPEACIYFQHLPSMLWELPELKKLTLRNLPRVLEISEKLGQLTALESLELSAMKEIKTLPDSVCSLSNLEYLILHDLPSFKRLPQKLGQLDKLRSLKMRKLPLITSIDNLPKSLWELKNIEEVKKDPYIFSILDQALYDLFDNSYFH